MTDDLVRRLRGRFELCNEAADRIEELKRELAKEKQYFKEVNEKALDVHARVHQLERQANLLVHALQSIVSVQNPKEWREFCEELIAETFAVLKGEK